MLETDVNVTGNEDVIEEEETQDFIEDAGEQQGDDQFVENQDLSQAGGDGQPSYEELMAQNAQLQQQLNSTVGRLKKTFPPAGQSNQQFQPQVQQGGGFGQYPGGQFGQQMPSQNYPPNQQHFQPDYWNQHQQLPQHQMGGFNNQIPEDEAAVLNRFINAEIERRIAPMSGTFNQVNQMLNAANQIAANKAAFSQAYPGLQISDVIQVMREDDWAPEAIQEVEMGLRPIQDIGELATKAFMKKLRTTRKPSAADLINNAKKRSKPAMNGSGSPAPKGSITAKLKTMSEDDAARYLRDNPKANDAYLKELGL